MVEALHEYDDQAAGRSDDVVRKMILPGVELSRDEIAAELNVTAEEEQAFQEQLDKIREIEGQAAVESQKVVLGE